MRGRHVGRQPHVDGRLAVDGRHDLAVAPTHVVAAPVGGDEHPCGDESATAGRLTRGPDRPSAKEIEKFAKNKET